MKPARIGMPGLVFLLMIPFFPRPRLAAGPGASAAKFEVDRSKSIDGRVSAAQGGQISFPADGQGQMHVVFPPGSLPGDMTIEAAPLLRPPSDKTILNAGFSIVNKDAPDKSIVLKSPAIVYFIYNGILPEKAGIARYNEASGDFEAVPVTREEGGGKTTLKAEVGHFTVFRCGDDKLCRVTQDEYPHYEISFDDHIEERAIDNTLCQVDFFMKLKSVGDCMYGKYIGRSDLSSRAERGIFAEFALEVVCEDARIMIPTQYVNIAENGRAMLKPVLFPGETNPMHVRVRGNIQYKWKKVETTFGRKKDPDLESLTLAYLLRGPMPMEKLNPAFGGQDLFFELMIQSFKKGKIIFHGRFVHIMRLPAMDLRSVPTDR